MAYRGVRDVSESTTQNQGIDWRTLAQAGQAGLNVGGTESGNDPASIAMNIASSTGEGALAGTAISPGWGSLIGAVAGLGKGIVTSAIGAHKAGEAESEVERQNQEMAETNKMIKTANRMSVLDANDERIRKANEAYSSLDKQAFTRAFTLGFTRAMRGA
jgi:hypothetical protein